MATINNSKVMVGGLVSGVVLFICDIAVNNALMAEDWKAIMAKLNVDMAAMQTVPAMAGWVVCDLLLGIVMVWTYAAIRPRFGPGPMTAVRAGLLMWATMTLMFYGLSTIGVFPMTYFLKNAVAYLIVMAAAALAGAYFYKED